MSEAHKSTDSSWRVSEDNNSGRGVFPSNALAHVNPCIDADVAFDGNRAAHHVFSDALTSVTVHYDVSTFHTAPVAAVRGAKAVKYVPFEEDITTLHLNSATGISISVYPYSSAFHPGATVHVNVAFAKHSSGCHKCPDVLDLSLIHISEPTRLGMIS